MMLLLTGRKRIVSVNKKIEAQIITAMCGVKFVPWVLIAINRSGLLPLQKD